MGLYYKRIWSKKARLVARGFEVAEYSNVVKHSPTCSKEGFRAVLTIVASHESWRCSAFDVKTAFLKGFLLKRNVYLEPPKPYKNSNLWKLRKCVYGLFDASRLWHERVIAEFNIFGLTQSKYDPSIFSNTRNDLPGVILTHVDDFWIAGHDSFVKDVIEKIQTVFTLGSIIEIPHKYLGLVVNLPNSGSALCLDMDCYRAGLQEMLFADTSNKERNLSGEKVYALSGIIGTLLWPAKQARPDIWRKLSEMTSQKHTTATVSVALLANKTVRHVNSGPPITLRYPNFQLTKTELACFSDASFNNYSDGSTHAGFITFNSETNTNKSAVLAGKSSKLRRVARST